MHEENFFYTMQDMLNSAEGITYLIVVASLIVFIFFWKFLTEGDSK